MKNESNITEEQSLKDAILEKGAEEYVEFLIDRFKTENTVKNVGTLDRRIQPCLVCGHNDCLTINAQTGLYHCFSCDTKGNVLSLAKLFTKTQEAITQALRDFTGLNNLDFSPEDKQLYRQRKLYQAAADEYHKQLILNEQALNFLLQVRKRKLETLEIMQTGYCADNKDFSNNLLNQGFTDEEIRSCYVPKGFFVYPYADNHGKITRFNTKNYFKVKSPDGSESKGYGIGKRQLLYSTGNYEDAIVLEGEQDYASLLEQNVTNVIATGENPTDEQIKQLRRFKKLYLLFDNDEGGRGFTEKVNIMLPDIDIYKIEIPEGYKDIDEYYTKYSNPVPFSELLKSAVKLENENCYSYVKGKTVILKNRNWRVDFEVIGYHQAKQLYQGNLKHFINDKLVFTRSGVIVPNGFPKNLLDYIDIILGKIQAHFNEGFNLKNLSELEEVYEISIKKNDIISVAAKRILDIEDKNLRDAELASLKNRVFKNEIFKELNAKENESVRETGNSFPLLNPGQAFAMNEENSIGYMYFNKAETDQNGNLVEYPCLLSSDKRIVFLSEYVQKSANQLLIIDHRFRIRGEVRSTLLDTSFVSLKQNYVEQYLHGDIPQEQLSPKYIIQAFEGLFRKVYYTPDDGLYKILAMYCYSTFLADLFGTLPYLYFTAEKGSGKSTLQSLISSLAFNPVFVIDITAASFLRIANMCSTMIIDEFESHSSRSKNSEDDIIPLIKGGYSKFSAGATRVNPDEFYKVDYYNVYSPKVFAAIGELDDVLRDRSICIILKKYKAEEIHDVLDMQVFKNKYHGEMVKLSSYAALSALSNFQPIYEAFNTMNLKFSSARFNQIMKPLYALANIVGEDFIEALERYSEKNAKSGEYIDSQSIEGAIKNTIKLIAQGWLNPTNFLNQGFVYNLVFDEITNRYILGSEVVMRFNEIVTKLFKIDGNNIYTNTACLTYLVNQMHDYSNVTLHSIHVSLGRIYPDNPLSEKTRTTTAFKSTELTEYFGKKANISCHKIIINVSEFGFDQIKEKMNDDEEKDLLERMQKNKETADDDLPF